MKSIVSTIVFFIILTHSLSAYATQGADTVTPQKSANDWSIGAGLLGSGYSYAMSGYVGGLASYPIAPTSSMTLERRLSENLWLTMGMAGNFSMADDDKGVSIGNTIVSKAFTGEVALGVRYIFNPKGAVEISAFGGLSFLYGTQTLKSDTDEWNNRALSGGIIAGLAIERQLLKNLYLRLHTTIGNVYFATVSSEVEDTGETNDVSQFRGGISLTPGIQLRLTF
jgi:hypothetical protein